MNRLSSRASGTGTPAAAPPPHGLSHMAARDGPSGSRASNVSLVTKGEQQPEGIREAEVSEVSGGMARSEHQRPSSMGRAAPITSAPLPVTPTPRMEAQGRQAQGPPETPGQGSYLGQAARFSIGSTPPERGHALSSPWR